MGCLADFPAAGHDHYLAVTARVVFPASVLTGQNSNSVDDYCSQKKRRADVWYMVRPRVGAGIEAAIGCHAFRAPGLVIA